MGTPQTLAGEADVGAADTLGRRGASGALATGAAIVAFLAIVKLLVHLATAGVYGLFVDELYFFACGELDGPKMAV